MAARLGRQGLFRATGIAVALLLAAGCSDAGSNPDAGASEPIDVEPTDAPEATDPSEPETTETESTDAPETTDEPTETTTATDDTAPSSTEAGHDHDHSPGETAGPASPDGMIEIAAGTFTIGIDGADQESVETMELDLPTFHLDEFEVSNAAYVEFVEQIGAPAPTTWPPTGMPAEIADQPVTAVPWEWAESFCRSVGKRLPTEAEWEVAARGTDNALFPWGDDASAVNLDVAGTREIGAEPANVSPYGVRDTVGSVWEWVGTPAVDVAAGKRVRKGGEYGRVRHGAAMRQAVDPGNVSVLEETGFRCATDSVDASIEPLDFTSGHEPRDDGDVEAAPVVTLAPGEFVAESFEDPRSGWPDVSATGWTTGYHAPSWYHLDASAANVQVFAAGPYRYDDAVVETAAYIDKIGTETGRFRYGLAFRIDGEIQPSPDGVGPDRPRDFYVFAINPREGIWELLHQDNLPLRVKRSGPLPDGVLATSSAQPDRFKVVMQGSTLVLTLNDTEVLTFNTEGYHLGGGIGFFSQTFDETKLHVHFDTLDISQV